MIRELYLVTSVLAFLTNVTLSLFIVYKNPKERINQIFSLWAISVGIICMGDFLRKTSTSSDSSMLWSRFMILGVLILMPTLLHFATLLRPKTVIKLKYFTELSYLPGILISGLLFTPLLIESVELQDWRYSIVWGRFMGVFGLIFGLYMISGTFLILRKEWAKKPQRYLFIIFGLLVLSGLFLNFLPNINLTLPTISPLAMFASSLFAYLVINNKYVVISLPEDNLESDMEYNLPVGRSYLVNREKESSYSLFIDQVTHGKAGLIFSRKLPGQIRKEYDLIKTQIFWLTKIKNENSVKDLKELTYVILSFLEASENNGVILLDGIEYLLTENGFLETLKAIHLINDYIMKDRAILLVEINPSILEEQQLNLLKTEMKEFRQEMEPPKEFEYDEVDKQIMPQ